MYHKCVRFSHFGFSGADSRTTTGTFIVNRVTDKLTLVHDTIWCCRYGGPAISYQLVFNLYTTNPTPGPVLLPIPKPLQTWCTTTSRCFSMSSRDDIVLVYCTHSDRLSEFRMLSHRPPLRQPLCSRRSATQTRTA